MFHSSLIREEARIATPGSLAFGSCCHASEDIFFFSFVASQIGKWSRYRITRGSDLYTSDQPTLRNYADIPFCVLHFIYAVTDSCSYSCSCLRSLLLPSFKSCLSLCECDCRSFVFCVTFCVCLYVACSLAPRLIIVRFRTLAWRLIVGLRSVWVPRPGEGSI